MRISRALAEGRVVRADTVTKDGMILSYIPNWDHGDVDNLGFGNANGGNRTLIEWKDIPAEEATDQDHQFLIALYSRETFSHPHPGPIHAFEITEDWRERISWQNQPKYDADPVGTYKFKPGKGWKVFDITSLVRDQAKAGRKSHGVLLRFLSEDFSAGPNDNHSDYRFVSREGTGEWEKRRPMLLVVKTNKEWRDRPRVGLEALLDDREQPFRFATRASWARADLQLKHSGSKATSRSKKLAATGGERARSQLLRLTGRPPRVSLVCLKPPPS